MTPVRVGVVCDMREEGWHSMDLVADMLLDIHAQAETILIVVTHSKELASRFPQRFELRSEHLEPL